jgi:hypothetical protein
MASAPRRENRSATAPVGIWAMMPTTHQMTNSAEIRALSRPLAANSSEYSG